MQALREWRVRAGVCVHLVSVPVLIAS